MEKHTVLEDRNRTRYRMRHGGKLTAVVALEGVYTCMLSLAQIRAVSSVLMIRAVGCTACGWHFIIQSASLLRG